MRDAGLLAGEADAGANDMLVVLRGDDPRVLEGAFSGLAEELNPSSRHPASGRAGSAEAALPRSLAMSLRETPADLALISVPGEYAAAEAFKALRLGLHVMLFSAGVSEADELALKRYAGGRGLLVMGPDCGTAIINGVPLGFANVVRRGDIGCVGASGTGLQEVTTLIHRYGGGVSQVVGTGGRDLSGAVGGLSTLQALEALARDPGTRVIVVVSKPPDPEVTARVVERAGRAGKPVVVNFLGTDPETGAAGRRRGADPRRGRRPRGSAVRGGSVPAGRRVGSWCWSGREEPAYPPRKSARPALHPRALQRRHAGRRGGDAAA